MRLGSLGVGAAVLLALAGCSSGHEGSAMPGVTTPTAGSAASGAAGLGAASAGRPATAGVTAPGVTTPPSTTVPVGTKPAAAGGSAMGTAGAAVSGMAGSSAVAGSGASAAAAGNGAVAGSSAAPGGGFMREAAPTEESIKKNGEYTVKSYTERDGLIGGMAYGDAALAGDGSELFYPEGATPPFAAMAIVPGFTAQRSDVAPWGPFLASHGIVALVIDTNTTGDQPDVRSLALLDAIESIKKENMREGSPMKGKIDTSRLGLMGWSMGGGGTWISADGHPELKVAVSLCGWIVQSVGSKTNVPSLQLAVLDDQLAAGMSQPVYAAIPDKTPKMLVEWSSGGHWINNSPENVNSQVGRYGLPWIKVFLESDERYRQFFKTMPTGASDFKTNQ